MRNLKKTKGTLMFLLFCLSVALAGCHKHDNVTPPKVDVSHSISGVVSSISGTPISGATVTATLGGNVLQATTDSEGAYKIDGIKTIGDYVMEAVANGKESGKGEVAIVSEKGSQAVVWDILLANAATEVPVSQTEETKVEMVTETTAGNEEAAVTIVATIPPAVVNEGEKIEIEPIYYMDNAKGTTRAFSSEELMVLGINLTCSNPNTQLKSPIHMVYKMDEEVAEAVKARKFVKGSWKEISVTVENGNVIFEADEFASYLLFFTVALNTTETTIPVKVEPAEYDNLYGKKKKKLKEDITYYYKRGAEITTKGTGKLSAHLVEVLARQLCGITAKDVTGSYHIDLTLPVGTAMSVSGRQEVTTISISCNNKAVSGKKYGNVNIHFLTYNRKHNGGGS